MRVLVTGGAGFIGSHVAAHLLAAGHRVVVLDDLSGGRVDHVPDGARFVRGDVRDPAALDDAAKDGLDAIAHLAGQASTFRSFDEPSWDLDVNGVGTARVLEAARRHGVRRFAYASSMTAYGDPEALPVTEDGRSAPISFYGVTKWAAERACVLAAQAWDMSLVAFRMFNVYGERQSLTNPYQGVLGIFLGNCLRAETIRIFGDGQQSRDFVHADDVARAWVAGLTRPPVAPAVVNLGTGSSTSIEALWRAAVAACGHDPETWPVERFPSRPGDQRHMVADIRRAEALLGWTPRIDLAAGLARTADWARTAPGSSR